MKAQADTYFRAKDYGAALELYLNCLNTTSGLSRAALSFNCAMCFFNIKQYERAVEYCSSSLDIDPRYSKVSFT